MNSSHRQGGGTPAAVLFDLDGTLIDSEPVHAATWQAFFAGRGVTLSADVYQRQVMGRRGYDVLRTLDGPWAEEDPAVLIAEVLSYLPAVTARVRPRPVVGASALLTQLRTNGVPVAVVTSATQDWVRQALDAALSPDLVPQVIVTADDVPVGKPDPGCYLLACDRLAIDPAGAVAVEDSPSGIAAARAAGVGRVVGILTTSPAQLLLAAGADAVVPDLSGAARAVGATGIACPPLVPPERDPSG